MNNKHKIDQVLAFCSSLLNTPYVLWDSQQKQDYFYCDNKYALSDIQQRGVNCAGFVNLVRQYSGLPIPELKPQYHTDVRGGTLFWYEYFKINNKLESFDYMINYPLGTLLLRNYRNQEDQGHMAILYENNEKKPDKILYSSIIHAYHDEQGGKVGKTILGYSHFCSYGGELGYYEYAILPSNWLNI